MRLLKPMRLLCKVRLLTRVYGIIKPEILKYQQCVGFCILSQVLFKSSDISIEIVLSSIPDRTLVLSVLKLAKNGW